MARHVPGHGPRPCPLMLTGEAPGRFEDKTGIPFSGPSGETLDWALWKVGLERAGCFVNNLLRYRPPGDRDPWPQEIERDEPELLADIKAVRPRIIAPLGTFATRWYFGEDVDMEMVHGRPRPWPKDPKVMLVPGFHPAAGMRDPAVAKMFMDDMAVLAAVAHGKRLVFPQDEIPAPVYTEIVTGDLPPKLWRWHFANPSAPIAIDTEGTKEYPYCLSFSVAPGEGWVILATNKAALARFIKFIAGHMIVLHNAMWDLLVLLAMGVKIDPARLRDTMIEAYLIQDLPKGLKPLAYRLEGMQMRDYDELTDEYGESQALNYLLQVPDYEWPAPEPQIKLVKGKWQVTQPQDIGKRTKAALKRFADKGSKLRKWWYNTDEDIRRPAEDLLGPMPRFTLDLVPRVEVIAYSGRDSDATIRVEPELDRRIEELGLTYARQLDVGILPMLVAMQEAGMPVDVPAMHAFGEELDGEMEIIQHRIEHDWNDSKPFNPRSSEHTAWLLFEKIGLKSRRMTPGGRMSTDDKTLEALKAETRHPAVVDITEYRERAKLKTDFCIKIPRMVDADSRVRGDIKNTTVVSGRLSMADPPMMAIPRRSDLGKRLRDCFVAKPGRCFVGGDLNQIEMRVLADDSGDEFLISLFREGRDVHDESASWIFNLPIEKVNRKTQRDPAKRIGFGVITGITEIGLWEQLRLNGVMKEPGVWYTKAECREMIDRWLLRYPGVHRYQLACRSEAKRRGRVSAADGRHRWLPWCSGPVYWVREEQLRQSHSLKIQAGMVKIIKEVMIDLWRELERGKLDATPLLQIHDELILECAERDRAAVERLLLDVMRSTDKLCVPVEADIHSATTWGGLK